MSISELQKACSEKTDGHRPPLQHDVSAGSPGSRPPLVPCTTASQVTAVQKKETSGGKPYFELGLQDSTGSLLLRVWSDHPSFGFCREVKVGDGVSISGTFVKTDFGIESKDWTGRLLDDFERMAVLTGSPEQKAKQDEDWTDVVELVHALHEGPLRQLCVAFLATYEGQFRRAAAARGNHHARRGGLLEHTAMMMRSAAALCGVYPDLNGDLLIAGVLFHDCGKMWENQFEPLGFVMPFSVEAECYGHIAMAVLLVHRLWKEAGVGDDSPRDKRSAAASEDRGQKAQLDLLCHVILSHHGCLEWGSPVEPKCPEAQVLHFIDNIDAKLERMRSAALTGAEIAPGVIGKVRPFGHNLLRTPTNDDGHRPPLQPT